MQHQRANTRILHEEQILEAIDQLRRRKARPDSDRICNYLLRKFSVDARDTIADLHRLIETEKVIQVDYKGNVSYRNASNWSRLQLYKNRPEGFVKDKLNSEMVASAVAELVVEEPDYLDQGVPAFRLVEQLLDGVSNPTFRRMVEDFLSKEIASGNLTRLSNGNYSLVATSDMPLPESITEKTVMENGSVVNASNKETTVAKNPYEFNDMEVVTIQDTLLNTPKSSRQSSPKSEKSSNLTNEKEVDGDVNNIIQNGKKDKEEGLFYNQEKNEEESEKEMAKSLPVQEVKEEQKNENPNPNLKKTGKAERKQKLMVRMDDFSEIAMQYDNFIEEINEKKSENSEKDKKDDNDRLSEDRDEEDAGRSSTNPSPTPSNNNAAAFRSARRKRAKKVFDPSDNNVVKRKRGRQTVSQNNKNISVNQESQEISKFFGKDTHNKRCSLCSKEKQESLMSCRDCTVRAHPTCIFTTEELLHKSCNSWQCERCKTCVACSETSEAGTLITCYNCDDAYHSFCHSPRVSATKYNSKWQCNDCTQKSYKIYPNQSINIIKNRSESPLHNTVLPPVLSPQVSPTRISPERNGDEASMNAIDPNIPDASDWTSEQVYQYFARLFPKEAEVFRQQDIDGHSLLMLKRSDVLKRLDLLLGPALKIYRHVLKLQVRRDDPKLYWL